MNISKLIGMCIVFAVLMTSVSALNQTMLNDFIDSYDASFTDGGFTVQEIRSLCTFPNVTTGESPKFYANFSVTGPSTSSPYTVYATLSGVRDSYTNKKQVNRYLLNTTRSAPGNVSFIYDGMYYQTGTQTGQYATFDIDVAIYQNNILSYQNKFELQQPYADDCENTGFEHNFFANLPN
ncbi:MAG TPA: hypothetical protein VKE88_02970, partial [Candidatus Nanoarchaeia archaeon]|nr:hypothetical protein [Candidatus Nanoarchaeia archaeon]